MAGVGPIDLHDVASEILAAAAVSLDRIPEYAGSEDLSGAPELQYVYFGPPTDDCCEQLVVWVDPVSIDQNRETRRAGWLTAPTFNILAGRCVPVGKLEATRYVPPPQDEIELASRQITADMWALWVGIHEAVDRAEILAACDRAYFDPVLARTPAGGCGGCTMAIRVTVHAFQIDPGS